MVGAKPNTRGALRATPGNVSRETLTLMRLLLGREERKQRGESSGRESWQTARLSERERLGAVEPFNNLIGKARDVTERRVPRDLQGVVLVELRDSRFLRVQIACIKRVREHGIKVRFRHWL